MNTEEKVRQMMNRARGEDEVSGAEWESFSTSARRSLRMQRMVAAGVGLVLIAAAVVGAMTIFDGEENRGLVTPVGPTDVETPESKPTAPSTPTAPSASNEQREIEIWLTQSGVLWRGSRLVGVPEGGLEQTLAATLKELIRGPIASDREVGARTALPGGTELLDGQIEDGVASIDLSSEFGRDTTSRADSLRNGQIVFTATQFEGIEQVQLFVEGMAITAPMGRDAFPETSPPIVVEAPKINSVVEGDVLVVEGTANVFEGTVQMKLVTNLGGKDQYTSGAFATATCGSGCRGTFEKELSVQTVDKLTEATLHVWEASAEDGSRLHEVTIPLTLLPNG